MDWTLFFWTLLLLLPLLWMVRRVHQGLQELFFLLTDHNLVAVYLFQVLLLPGVLLHEASHYFMAQLVGVRVRKVSFRPEIQRDKIQMGAVVMDQPDFVRSLLIGLAPLVVGSIVIVLVGRNVFDVDRVIEAATNGNSGALINAIRDAFSVNDAWIWFYLIFAVSNAMLPSESDRSAMWPMLTFIGIIGMALFLAGWGPALISRLAEPVETALSMLVVAFGTTLFVDIVFLALLALLRTSVTSLTGRRLEKGL
jgi:hypothetical protein